jgi:hypothetical protein
MVEGGRGWRRRRRMVGAGGDDRGNFGVEMKVEILEHNFWPRIHTRGFFLFLSELFILYQALGAHCGISRIALFI